MVEDLHFSYGRDLEASEDLIVSGEFCRILDRAGPVRCGADIARG